MSEKYLIINAGSSSLKFSLYKLPEKSEIVNGYIERIGKKDSFYTLKENGVKTKKEKLIMDHNEAVVIMLKELLNNKYIEDINEIKGIGHRILHGGEFYNKSVIIDENVLNNIKSLIKFGPLHLPGEIAGIESMKNVMQNVPQVATFDTAFHQTMPIENYLYALPYNWYEENGVRKYGFHGISHKYITETMKKYFGKNNINLIICHIGSGVSMCCVKEGKSYNTTMGLTPLDGNIMGTRCGNIDSSILNHISKDKHLSIDEITSILNNKSGLLGICGKNDFRDVENLAKKGDEKAILAIKMLRNSISKYIAQYYVELNGKVDAIVFTAGIGENSISLREEIVNSISSALNIELDKKANSSIASFKEKQSGIISTPESKTPVFVVPTNEEIIILNDINELINKENIKTLKLNNKRIEDYCG